jgi:DNA polymerase I-like protein with 3'-5' exonuclease and polymerase domains
MFWDGTPGVYKLIKSLESYHMKHKFIRGLDNRKIHIRAKYKLLNSLIQSAAAIIFKTWGVMAMRGILTAGLDCKQIIAYHDEYEYRCHKSCVEEASRIIKEAALDAGKYYKLSVPITTDIKVGRNWAMVH